MTDENTQPKAGVLHARYAVGITFFVNGGAVATWASRIPAVQEKLALNTGQLGIALLSMAVGALIAMSVAGALSSRFGSRPVIAWTLICSCVSLILPAFAANLFMLAFSVTVLGLFLGSLDVAMNAHAVAVEHRYGRPTMSLFHAMFSIGGIVLAAFGAWMASLGVSLETHFCISAVGLLAIGLSCLRWLLPADADSTGSRINPSLHIDGLKHLFGSTTLLAIGVVMFCSFLVEGAMGDWSGVFLRKVLGTDSGFAALGYACYSATMCIGRLFGDAIVRKLQATSVVRAGSFIAVLGLALAIFSHNPTLALVGFACVGLGMANIVPIAFTSAGSIPNSEPAKTIASSALMGYFGLLIGPPLIGFAAEVITLPGALCLLGILLCVIALLGSRLTPANISTAHS